MENDQEEPFSKRPRLEDQDEKDAEPKCKEGQRGSELSQVPKIPTFSIDCLQTMSSQEFLDAYNMYQALHFKISVEKHSNDDASDETPLTWKDVGSVYKELSAADKKSWCIENHETINRKEGKDSIDIQTEIFLAPEVKRMKAYCSFLVQKDKQAFQRTLQKLPLPNLGTVDQDWVYEPCLWIFFGRNNTSVATSSDCKIHDDKSPLEGRGLHTDSVSHDGTWHYQLSGRKEWFLSPSYDLLRYWKEEASQKERQQQELEQWDESTQLHAVCEKGDVLVVNTRLWFHRTVIPNQENPSVSYARDFCLANKANHEGSTNPPQQTSDEHDNTGSMTNVDGMYARTEIEAGTIIFTERDMPDCELHRSNDNPNCEVVELDGGTSAIVSRRTITCGEFFCVAESSDEEEDDEDEGESVGGGFEE